MKAGDEVATSATFLIDSESRLEAGGGSMAGMPGMGGGDKGHGKAADTKPDDMKAMPGMGGPPQTTDHSKPAQ